MELYHITLSLQEKLEILSDAAKYDVSCTSSGVDRRGKKGLSWQFLCRRHLPQFCRGRQMYLPAEDPAE